MTNDSRHRMWITADAVYHYDWHTNSPPVKWATKASGNCVKAFGTWEDGQIVEARRPGCTGSFYRNDTIYLFRYDGTHRDTRTLEGAGFYKARPVIWSPR